MSAFTLRGCLFTIERSGPTSLVQSSTCLDSHTDDPRKPRNRLTHSGGLVSSRLETLLVSGSTPFLASTNWPRNGSASVPHMHFDGLILMLFAASLCNT